MPTQSRRRPALVVAGAVGTAALALSMSGTLSAFSASITNDANTAGVGTLAMLESGPDGAGGTATCQTTAGTTSATCSTINKYGGDAAMDTGANATNTTTITLQNTGTIAASSFTLTPGACTLTNPQANSGDLCSTATVTITQDGTQVFTGSPAALAAGGVINLSTANATAGATSTIAITFSTAGTDNTVQGESVSQPLTWTYNA